MTKDERDRQLSDAYHQLQTEITTALYNADPEGMGRSVGAPEDEYSGAAATLCSRLKGAISRGDVRRALETIFGADLVRDDLVAQVYAAWDAFSRRFGTETPPRR